MINILPKLPFSNRLRRADELARKVKAQTHLISTWAARSSGGENDIPELEIARAAEEAGAIDLKDAFALYDLELTPGARIRRILTGWDEVNIFLNVMFEGARLDTHRHDAHDELIFVLNGELRSTTNARILRPDSPVDFVPAGVRHGYVAEKDSTFVVLFAPPLPVRVRED